MTLKNKSFSIFAFLSIISFTSFSQASTQVSNIQTQAQLQAVCTFTIPNFTFGNISYKSDKLILNSLNYTCNSGITGTATLSKGNSTNFLRVMNNGQPDSDTLRYNIFLPGNNTPIGDGTDGSRTLTLNGTGKEEFMWISGSVLRNQYIRPGNYSDNLTLTVTY